MSVLLAGGDRLGMMYGHLKEMGFTDFKHISGRKKNEWKKIDKKPDLCILFVNFASHNLAKLVRNECKKKNIPILCSERKWSHLKTKLISQGYST